MTTLAKEMFPIIIALLYTKGSWCVSNFRLTGCLYVASVRR